MKVAGHAAVGAVFTLLMMSIWFSSWKLACMAVVVAIFAGGYAAFLDDSEGKEELYQKMQRAQRELDVLKMEIETGMVKVEEQKEIA